MKTKNLLFTAIATILFIAGAHTQNVNIPDVNFKAALVGNASINTNMDAEIQITEANVYSGSINVSNLSILDLTGIEAFVVLNSLDCSSNFVIVDPGGGGEVGIVRLENLNVSANTALTYLNCSSNGLTSLDVSACSALTYFDCSLNNPYWENNTSGNGGYWTGSLTNLTVSANIALTYLDCSKNHISGLDVSANTALTYLDCSENNAPIQLWPNEPLTGYYYFLNTLDDSNNTVLTTLKCSSNGLLNIDVSYNFLTYLDCNNNKRLVDGGPGEGTYIVPMNSLDLRNGNNSNMQILAQNNFLSCISVDSAAWSTANWSNNIDATASFSENCSGVGILDNNESNAANIYPNPTTGAICLSEKGNIALSDLSGKLLLEQKNTNQLDISLLPAGIYFLSLGENTKQTFKIIKE